MLVVPIKQCFYSYFPPSTFDLPDIAPVSLSRDLGPYFGKEIPSLYVPCHGSCKSFTCNLFPCIEVLCLTLCLSKEGVLFL
jgi:hypothetical protein